MLSTPHIASNFDDLLQDFRGTALLMASLTVESFERACFGFLNRDEDACNQAIADDEEIDALEVRVDHEGMTLMMRYHPFATDFRNVLATMKFGINLERVADQSVNIARRTRRMLRNRPLDAEREMMPLIDLAAGMLRDAIRAYADSDLETAGSLKLRDRELDRMNRDLAEHLASLMPDDIENIPTYIDLIFIARFLERIGDLAKAIGEDTVFAISATDTRHA